MLYAFKCIRTNTKRNTTSTLAKWRQQQAHLIQSSYSEGSTLKRCAIDAHINKNCYILVLEAVNKQESTAAAASTKLATCTTASPGYTINSVAQADLNSVKADKATQNSVYKVLQLLKTVSCEANGTTTFNSVTFKLGAVTTITLIVAKVVAESQLF
jgi:hypothetical protein